MGYLRQEITSKVYFLGTANGVSCDAIGGFLCGALGGAFCDAFCGACIGSSGGAAIGSCIGAAVGAPIGAAFGAGSGAGSGTLSETIRETNYEMRQKISPRLSRWGERMNNSLTMNTLIACDFVELAFNQVGHAVFSEGGCQFLAEVAFTVDVED